MSNSLGGLDHTTFASRHAAREGGSSVVPLENLEMFERMGVSFSYIILADAHFSHDTPRNSVVDLPVACFPRAREPGFTPSNRRAPQVCRKAPKLTAGVRLLWICLSRLWRSALAIVKPETVVAWHRAAFRLFWTWKVRCGKPGRPVISSEVRDLIRKIL